MTPTLLIPLGEFPLFIKVCTENVLATCGESVDIIFLTSKTISPFLQEEFEKQNCKVLSAPFDIDNHDQLSLLDWAVYEADIQNLVFTHHADWFWAQNQKDWASKLLDGKSAIGYKTGSIFLIDETPVSTLDDAFILVDREKFIKRSLSFQSGKIGHKLNASEELLGLIKNGRIRYKKTGEVVEDTDYFNGSRLLTLEAGCRFENEISQRKYRHHHFRQFFKHAGKIRIEGDTLKIKKENLHLKEWGIYSWLTSFGFDAEKFRDIIFPFAVLKKLLVVKENVFDLEKFTKIYQWILKERLPSTIGDKDILGIKKVVMEQSGMEWKI